MTTLHFFKQLVALCAGEAPLILMTIKSWHQFDLHIIIPACILFDKSVFNTNLSQFVFHISRYLYLFTSTPVHFTGLCFSVYYVHFKAWSNIWSYFYSNKIMNTRLLLVTLYLCVVLQCWDVAENQQRIMWTKSGMNSKVCVIKFSMMCCSCLFPCHKHCDSQTKDANHVMHKGWGSVLAVFSMFTLSLQLPRIMQIIGGRSGIVLKLCQL